jgi:hypothetical protein
MKRKTGKRSAFAKLKAGLEDAIAYHGGARQLTVRDVDLEPPPRRERARSGRRRAGAPSHH